MCATSPSLSGSLFKSRLSRSALLIASLLIFPGASPAGAQPTDSCTCINDFVAASDVNRDGLPLTVADHVFLARVLSGDTALDSGCVVELDGYQNSFFPGEPSIGDLIAYSRYFAFGLGSIPVIDCENLKEPLASGLEIVVPGPLALTGIANSQHTVELHNTGPDSAFIWGLTVPLDLQMFGSDFTSFSFMIDSSQPAPGWSASSRMIDSAYAIVTIFSDVPGGPAPVTLGPGEEIALFDFILDWITGGEAYILPRLHVSTKNTAPYVVSAAGPTELPLTEVLGLTLDNCCDRTGDANGDGRISIADVINIIDVIFGDLGRPDCITGADFNTDNTISIGDVTAGIGHIFVEPLDISCANCPYTPEVSYPYWSVGDVNLNGISYEIADWVTLANYLLYGFDALHSSPLNQLGQSDVDMNCEAGNVGEFVNISRVIVGETLPNIPSAVAHFVDDVTVSITDSIISVDAPVRGLLLVFPGETTPELLVGDVLMGSEYVDGYTRTLVYPSISAPPVPQTMSGDLLRVDRSPVYVEAADSLGALYNVWIVPAAAGSISESGERK